MVGCENFSFVEVSYECVMVARLKQLDMLIVKAIRHGKDMPIYQSHLNTLSVPLIKNRYSNFLEKVFVFQKIFFKVKVLKTFKISSDCYIKTCRSFKWKAILKFSSTAFLE